MREPPTIIKQNIAALNSCAPTTAAITLGYWDLHGYDRLFDASGWESVRCMIYVQDHISSEQHREYNPSQGSSYIAPGIREFTELRGYQGNVAFQVDAIATTWKDYMDEIDSGNPVFRIVGSDKDGIEDHAVAGIGYEQRGESEWWYAYYESFSEDDAEHFPTVDVTEGVFAKYLKWSPSPASSWARAMVSTMR